jgi:hypothetical protein
MGVILKADFAIECANPSSLRFRRHYTETLCDHGLVFSRSVKISDLAAMKDLRKLTFNKGCKITDFNGPSLDTS